MTRFRFRLLPSSDGNGRLPPASDLCRFVLCGLVSCLRCNCKRSIVYQVSDCLRWGNHSPLIPCPAKPEPQRRLKPNKEQVQKEQKYDYRHKTNRGAHSPRAERHETNTSCDGQRCLARSIKAAKSSSIPRGDRRKGLRDLALAGTGSRS